MLVGAGASAIVLTVIAHFEGVRYEPYKDVGGVLTVCYGHTGIDIVPNKVYSKEECNELLELDFMGTKPIVAVIFFMLLAISMIVFGAYRLTDNTCGIDKASLEKCCQKAIDHYKGRQVNF
ncbi:glycoside hydrolase family protein [Providencia rettgeri]|uniref:glycoside hydrolase family protein n=1 Tax=Providencia huaxiensis TaxID=2027290 RepID=UPI003D818E77